ncbi:hypothetical protein ABZ912_32385 [Nonomuraea angiospora]|uniref:hypothetical protein n=1 Tax=Nonomuraea angiospora TaxID=46172 RepID=UPI0033F483E0
MPAHQLGEVAGEGTQLLTDFLVELVRGDVGRDLGQLLTLRGLGLAVGPAVPGAGARGAGTLVAVVPRERTRVPARTEATFATVSATTRAAVALAPAAESAFTPRTPVLPEPALAAVAVAAFPAGGAVVPRERTRAFAPGTVPALTTVTVAALATGAAIIPIPERTTLLTLTTRAAVVAEAAFTTRTPIITEPALATRSAVVTEPAFATRSSIVTGPAFTTRTPIITEATFATRSSIVTGPALATRTPIITEAALATRTPIITKTALTTVAVPAFAPLAEAALATGATIIPIPERTTLLTLTTRAAIVTVPVGTTIVTPRSPIIALASRATAVAEAALTARAAVVAEPALAARSSIVAEAALATRTPIVTEAALATRTPIVTEAALATRTSIVTRSALTAVAVPALTGAAFTARATVLAEAALTTVPGPPLAPLTEAALATGAAIIPVPERTTLLTLTTRAAIVPVSIVAPRRAVSTTVGARPVVGTERTVAAGVSPARAVPAAPAASAGAPVPMVAAPALSAVRSVISVHFWSISLAHSADSQRRSTVAGRCPLGLTRRRPPVGGPVPSSLASPSTSMSPVASHISAGPQTHGQRGCSLCHQASRKSRSNERDSPMLPLCRRGAQCSLSVTEGVRIAEQRTAAPSAERHKCGLGSRCGQ